MLIYPMHRKSQDILNLNFTVHQCIFCTHIWGFIYTMGVHLTCGAEPLPWNMVCILSHATFVWIHSLDSLVSSHLLLQSMQWCIWLRQCTISRRLQIWFPVGVIGIFHWLNPFSCTMAQGLPKHCTEMSTRSISCG
jgi:hypothetical protein